MKLLRISREREARGERKGGYRNRNGGVLEDHQEEDAAGVSAAGSSTHPPSKALVSMDVFRF